MPLALQPCVAADIPRVFELISVCFGHEHEYIDAVFPAHDTPAGRAAGSARFLQMMEQDPHTSFWKVTDSAIAPDGQGAEILGIAKWNVYKDDTVPAEAELGGEWWAHDADGIGGDEEQRRSYAALLYKEYLIERRRAIRESGGNLVSLDILVTDPAHQRRGAGKMLVEHGTRIADELGVRAVVEASTYGRHLYELCGFRMEKFIVLQDVPERYSSRPRQEFFWMVRPSRAERDLHGAAEQRTEEKVTRTEKVGGVKVEEVREVPV